MIRWCSAGVAVLFSISFTAPAQSQECTGLSIGGVCLIGNRPEARSLDPADKDQLLRIIPPKQRRLPNPDELYKVDLSCASIGSPGLIDWGPFVQTSVTTSHIVALTPTRLSSSQLPSDAKAAVTVFSVSGDKKSRSIFKNEKCDTSFAVSGRDKLFIAATANKTDTNQPGPLAAGVAGLIQVALPILPLFAGVGPATNVLKAASQANDPLTKLYSQLDRGNTVTQSQPLYQGVNTVRTPYSTVKVSLSKIKSVTQDPDLIGPYENIVKDAYTTLKIADKAVGDLAESCRRFDALMRDRNLSPDDISYGLVLLTLLSGFDQTKTLTCMGSDYALSGLSHVALWKRYMEKPVYDAGSAKAFFYRDDLSPRPPHKEFARVQKRLEFAMYALGGYTLSRGQNRGDVDSFFTDKIYVVNFPGTPFDGPTEGAFWTRDDFLKRFISADPSAAFRIACLTSDTEGDGLFLAFSAKPPNQPVFADDDAVALRVWLDGDGRIGWVTLQQNVDLVEKAVPASRFCGKNLKVTPLPKPKEPQANAESERRSWRVSKLASAQVSKPTNQ